MLMAFLQECISSLIPTDCFEIEVLANTVFPQLLYSVIIKSTVALTLQSPPLQAVFLLQNEALGDFE